MRHTIYIERNSIDDAGNSVGSYSHLITLSNKTALERVLEYIQNLEWLDDLVSIDDILVYDDKLDSGIIHPCPTSTRSTNSASTND